MVREGFSGILALEGDLVVLGEAKNGREAATFGKKLCSDVVLIIEHIPWQSSAFMTSLV